MMDFNGGPNKDWSGREFSLSDPVNSFVDTVKGVLLGRGRFFSGIATPGSLKAPLVFGVVCLLISWFLGVILDSFAIQGGLTVVDNSVFGLLQDRQFLNAAAGTVLTVVFYPLAALITLFFYSAIVHLLAMILMRERLSFGATLRVYCYTSAVALLSWVPYLGGLATLYGLYLLVVGLREVHGSAVGDGTSVAGSSRG